MTVLKCHYKVCTFSYALVIQVISTFFPFFLVFSVINFSSITYILGIRYLYHTQLSKIILEGVIILLWVFTKYTMQDSNTNFEFKKAEICFFSIWTVTVEHIHRLWSMDVQCIEWLQWSLFSLKFRTVGQQIGQVYSGEFGVFSARLSGPILVF